MLTNCYALCIRHGHEEMSTAERRDNRKPNDLRKVSVEFSVVNDASSSCYMEIGNTKLLCVVRGPRISQRSGAFSDRGQVDCEVCYAPFAISPAQKYALCEEKVMAQLVVDALECSILLENYAKCVISLYITILEAGGCELGAAITCASTALAAASIELRSLVHSSTIALVHDVLFVDPTLEELNQADATVTLATLAVNGHIAQIDCFGQLNDDLLASMIKLGYASNESLCRLVRHHIEKHVASRDTK